MMGLNCKKNKDFFAIGESETFIIKIKNKCLQPKDHMI